MGRGGKVDSRRMKPINIGKEPQGKGGGELCSCVPFPFFLSFLCYVLGWEIRFLYP